MTPALPVAGRAARRRTMAPVRWAVRLKNDPPFDAERWRYGFLVDTIFTRDTWMHRLDISRATGRPMELTAGHDGRLVADVVTEWARRHGQPFALTLTGTAGGQWRSGRLGSTSSSMRSTSAGSSPPGSPAPGSWPRRSHSDFHHPRSAQPGPATVARWLTVRVNRTNRSDWPGS